MALTKKQIAQSVKQEVGASLNQAYPLLKPPLGRVKASPASGEDVLISGLGKFTVMGKKYS